MEKFVPALINFAENVVVAILIFAAGYLIARVVRTLTRRLLERIKIATTFGPTIPMLVSSVVYYVILTLAGLVSLLMIGVPSSILIVGLAAIVLIFSLALQQSVSNFAATVNMLVFQPFKRGEVVTTMGWTGTVREILPFNTVLQLPDERLVTLPNSKIQDSGIVNYSRMGHLWADFSVKIRHDQDVDRVRAVIAEIAAQDARILTQPPLDIHIDDLDEKGIRLSVRPYVPSEYAPAVRVDLRAKIHARFQAEGIKFALP
jgi:small conductance mechanosensitive channel